MLNKILDSKTKTITSAAILLFFSGFFSRLLGLLRDNLLANRFPKETTDIYFAAFQIPDLIYGILISAGIVVTFLPILTEKFKENHNEAKDLINNVFTFFLFGLIFISLILSFFSLELVKIIAPGFSLSKQILTAELTRIMFLSPILLGVSAIFAAVLQYFNLFFAIALAPILYNLGIIFGILFLVSFLGLPGLAWGVILGALLHLLIQIVPLSRIGFLPRFSFNFKNPSLKKILILTIPRTMGTTAYHLNLIIITAIASLLSSGAVSIFNFSNNLRYLPIGLIGLSFATASFPLFSKIFVEKNKEKFSEKFTSLFSRILFLIIPLSCLIVLFRTQLTQLILGTSVLGQGYFGWEQIKLTAASLGLFGLFLFASCLVPFLLRIFYAVQNTKTPMKIAFVTVVFNLIFCWVFVWLLGFSNFFQKIFISVFQLEDLASISVIGLALAFSLSGLFQFFLLMLALKKELKFLEFEKIYSSFKKILLSAVLMTLLTYSVFELLYLFSEIQTPLEILFQLTITSLIAFSSYLIFGSLLKIKEAQIICRTLKILLKFQ